MSAAVSGVIDGLARRASHEVKNALNAAAVNLEVVRSRTAQGKVSAEEVGEFAKRAAKEQETASTLAIGALDLLRVFATSAEGAMIERSAGKTSLRLENHAGADAIPSGEMRALLVRMGVAVEVEGSATIFTLPSEV